MNSRQRNRRGIRPAGNIRTALRREMRGNSHVSVLLAATRPPSRTRRAVDNSNSNSSAGDNHPLRVTPQRNSATSSADRRAASVRKGRDNARISPGAAAGSISRVVMDLGRRVASRAVGRRRVSRLVSLPRGVMVANVRRTAARSSLDDRCDGHVGTSRHRTGLNRPGTHINDPADRDVGAATSVAMNSGSLFHPETVRA